MIQNIPVKSLQEKYEIILSTTCICTKIEEGSSIYIWTKEYRVGETYKCEFVKYLDKKWQAKYYPRGGLTEVGVYFNHFDHRETGPCYFSKNHFHEYFILTGEHRENKINKLFE